MVSDLFYLIDKIMSVRFVLFGYSVSFWSLFFYTWVVGLIVWFLCKLLD